MLTIAAAVTVAIALSIALAAAVLHRLLTWCMPIEDE